MSNESINQKLQYWEERILEGKSPGKRILFSFFVTLYLLSYTTFYSIKMLPKVPVFLTIYGNTFLRKQNQRTAAVFLPLKPFKTQ